MLHCAACDSQNDDDQTYCQSCGAALSTTDGEDDLALSLMMGLVCPACDSYNDPGTNTCVVCNAALDGPGAQAGPESIPETPVTPPSAGGTAPPAWMQAPEGKPMATALALPKVSLEEVARQGASLEAPEGTTPPQPAEEQHPATVETPTPIPAEFSQRACVKCSADLGPNDKFCRICGTPADANAPDGPGAPAGTLMMAAAKLPAPPTTPPAPGGATMMMPSLGNVPNAPAPTATMFFGAAQVQRFARLSLVKGHTQFGTQWRLQAGETVVGRNTGMVLFPDDQHLGDPHFRIVFEDDGLYLVPDDEKNGVFVALREAERLDNGTEFIIGVQRLRYRDGATLPRAHTAPEGDTPFLGSMMREAELLCLERVFSDPRLSETYVRPQRILSLGRRRCDVNFPDDPYLSTRHAEVVRDPEGVILRDLQSRNGTFLRIHQRRKLRHGDAIMFGEQVLRVEVQG